MNVLVCGVRQGELRRFAEGGAVELEAHVAGCEHCQAFLEDVWGEGLDRDLAPGVLRTIDVDEFVRGAVGLAAGIGAAMIQAIATYTGMMDDEEDR
ncbi:MAG: hypothetical protein R3290_09475 [Acidimicrobiia bacterium]|nr:hypothetical protein [Acidimicrobiia bacterium]